MRRLAFVGLVAAPAIAALLLASRHEPPAGAHRPTPTALPRETPPAAPRPGTPLPRRAARRFVEAFLAYEAGAVDPATRNSIRRLAGHALAARLLADPPRPSDRPGARILDLHLARLPHRPDLALLTGSARRPSGPEPFAFLFAHRAGRWMAIAPAE